MLNWSEKGKKEYYWALVLEPGLVQAGVWEIIEKKAEVVAISSPAIWETDAELVGAADTALSSSIQSLPEDTVEPTKTVFGVPTSWVDQGQIKDEYLAQVKKICTDLSLAPTGFVVLPEAIAHLAKAEEGAPLNAIVTQIGKDYLEISVFKLGNLAGSTAVARSVSVFEDVIEGLSRFSGIDSLPSRIIIYDGKEGELDEAKELLTGSEWQGVAKVKFLHTPKIEILPPEKKVIATALAGAAEIAGATEVEKVKEEEDFEEKIPMGAEHKNLVEPESSVSAQELGFVVGEDIAAKSQAVAVREPAFQSTSVIRKPVPKKSIFADVGLFFHAAGQSFNKLFAKRPGKISFPGQASRKLWIFGVVVLVVIVLVGVFWWVVPHATIKIFVSPKQFEEKKEITINSQVKTLDLSGMVVPGVIVSTQVSGDKTASTTGTKKVGDKAKGTVNIQNGTGAILNLPVGTVLTSANNLSFATVAEASVSAALSPSNPGTQTVDVTASDIGAEFNLAKDEIFKIGNFAKAEVDAVATGDFTGGSSREISAVSADDAKNLTDALISELTETAKNQLLEDLASDRIYVDDSLTATPSAKTLSNKVGDEATNLKLSLTLKVNALTVAKSDLISLSQKVLQGAAPTGFSLSEGNMSFGFTHLKDVGTAAGYNLNIVANYLPEVDSVTLIKKISGRALSGVDSDFSTIPGFSRAEIELKPMFPGPLGIIPLVSKNIKVEIVSEK